VGTREEQQEGDEAGERQAPKSDRHGILVTTPPPNGAERRDRRSGGVGAVNSPRGLR
jgi:hypothetical protein